jgi:ABC-type oligopeptide transport system substrate-binding subunit
VRCRHALARAIDRQRLVADLYGGGMLLATGFLPPNIAVSRSAVSPFAFDPDSARNEIAELWPSPRRSLRLFVYSEATASTPDPGRAAQLIAENLRAVGVAAEPVFLPIDQWVMAIRSGDHDLALGGIGPDYPDPENYFLFFSREGIRAGLNHGLYSSDAYEALLSRAKGERSPGQRLALFRQLEEKLCEDLPALPVAFLRMILVSAREIVGLSVPDHGAHGMPFSLLQASLKEG